MQLKFVTDRDAGRYECQVSSHPPVSNYIHLKVVGECSQPLVLTKV